MASDNESIHELLVRLKHGDGIAEVSAEIYRRMYMPLYRCGVDTFKLSHENADDLASTSLMHILFGKKRNGEAVISSYNEKQHRGEPWIKRVFERKVIDWKREEFKRQGREVCPVPDIMNKCIREVILLRKVPERDGNQEATTV
jgi:hypothetical protein